MRPLQRLAGVGAEPVAQVAAVALDSAPGRPPGRGPPPRCAAGRRAATRRPAAAACAASSSGSAPAWAPIRLAARASDEPGRPGVGGGRPPHLGQRAAAVPGCGEAIRQRQRFPGEFARRARRPGPARRRRPWPAAASRMLSTSPGAAPSRYPAPSLDDHVRAVRTAGPRHQHLQALQPVDRRVVAPDQLDQLVGGHRPAAARGQRRQQRLRAIARHWLLSPAHVPQQAQARCSPGQSKNYGALVGGRDFVWRKHRPGFLAPRVPPASPAGPEETYLVQSRTWVT